MGKSFTFYLKGAHNPITIADVNESRTLPELKQSIGELLVKRDTLIFCTDTDCVILKPEDISGITITNYTSKNRVSIESAIELDALLDEEAPVNRKPIPTKPKIEFEDLGIGMDDDEPLVEEEEYTYDHDELDIKPAQTSVERVEQARNSFMNEIDDFVAQRENKTEKKNNKSKGKAAKDKLLEDVKLAKTHVHTSTHPSPVIIDIEEDGEDIGDDIE